MTKFHSRKISVIGLKVISRFSALVIKGEIFQPFIIHFCFRFASHYNVVQMIDNRSFKKITSLIVRLTAGDHQKSSSLKMGLKLGFKN